jgi:hypothetical protein
LIKKFDLKKLDDLENEKRYQVEISSRLEYLESLDESFDNNAPEVLEKISTLGPK